MVPHQVPQDGDNRQQQHGNIAAQRTASAGGVTVAALPKKCQKAEQNMQRQQAGQRQRISLVLTQKHSASKACRACGALTGGAATRTISTTLISAP
jgi:hypothetical protein